MPIPMWFFAPNYRLYRKTNWLWAAKSRRAVRETALRREDAERTA